MTVQEAAKVARFLPYGVETLRIEQIGSDCLAYDMDGTVYARLSSKLSDQAPEGHFWLRWWNENQRLAEALFDAGMLRQVGDPVLVSGFVSTVACRLLTDAEQHSRKEG